MSRAFQCDGCFKLKEAEPFAVLSLVPHDFNLYMKNTGMRERAACELCADCLKAIDEAILALHKPLGECP